MKKLNTAKWISLVMGILLLIIGVLYLINPLGGATSLVIILSVMLLMVGVLRIIRYFSSDLFHSGGFLIGGILDVLLGFIMLRNLEISLVSFTFMIGFWVLVNGITEIATSFDLKRLQLSYWWVSLLSGIVGVLFGVLLLGNFGLAAFYVSLLVSIYMFTLGVSLISMFFSVNRFQKNHIDA